MNRKTGYYWIKHHNEWTVGYYDANNADWYIIGSDVAVKSNILQEINETRLQICKI